MERSARVEAELGGENPAPLRERLERLGLAAAPVERDHQLSSEPLAERLTTDALLELADELGVPPEGQVGLDPILERGGALLLEPSDMRLRERLVGQIGERRAAPEAEGVTQAVRRLRCVTARQRASRRRHELGERGGVELARLDP